MKKASLVVSTPYQGNRIFDSSNLKLNRDNCLAPFHHLRKAFQDKGVDLSTQDINSINESDYIIYNDMPSELPERQRVGKSHLLILESPLVVKNSWQKERLDRFSRVYSWNDSVADNVKFIKVNYSFDFPESIEVEQKRKKFCCLISANKVSSEENELYGERIKTIRWFEKNSREDFDLYGIGWDRPSKGYLLGNIANKLINYLPFLKPAFQFNKFPSYIGTVESKKEVMQEYKFCICYENIHGLQGYITEKIFDCFFAGCIPIYWGADNIEDYIPLECFIDRRKFSTNAKLYDYLKSLSNENCLLYRKNIQQFLKSEKAQLFSVQKFAEIVSSAVLEAH